MLQINIKLKQGLKNIPFITMPTSGNEINLVVDINDIEKLIDKDTVGFIHQNNNVNNDNEINPIFMTLLKPSLLQFIATGKINYSDNIPEELKLLKQKYDNKFQIFMAEEIKKSKDKICPSCKQGEFIRKNIKEFFNFFYSKKELLLLNDILKFFDKSPEFTNSVITDIHNKYQDEFQKAMNNGGCSSCIKNAINKKYLAILKNILLNYKE